MDWTPIFTFATGALVALLPIIITNRFQAKEREKERLEQRREARIQARQKWEERDILQIMEAMDVIIKSFSEAGMLILYYDKFTGKVREAGLSEKSQLDGDLKVYDERFANLFFDLQKTVDSMSRLVFSFDDDRIRSIFTEFMECATKLLNVQGKTFDKITKREPLSSDVINLIDLKQSAGDLQRALREKLISLRE